MTGPSSRGPADKPQLNRRDLLRGRLWKLIQPSTYKSLVMRYPKHGDDITAAEAAKPTQRDRPVTPRQLDQPRQPARPRKTIGGISIEPVAVTPLASGRPLRSLPVFRPPGAVEESQFLAGCTRCGDCTTACPHDAIKPAPQRLGQIPTGGAMASPITGNSNTGNSVVGTPIIDADTQACLMCEDFPCIASCPSGVLTENGPKIMGTARITEHLCIAHHGTPCTVCSDRCPVDNAITVVAGKPTVNEAVCSGCGVCRQVCPAPENAVLLMPTFSRPPYTKSRR